MLLPSTEMDLHYQVVSSLLSRQQEEEHDQGLPMKVVNSSVAGCGVEARLRSCGLVLGPKLFHKGVPSTSLRVRTGPLPSTGAI